MQNDKNIVTNLTSNKGMIKDVNSSNIAKDTLSHARNAVINSHQGDLFFYSTEPSNLHCADLPYKYNGSVPLKDQRHLVFSTDNVDSEIGVLNERDCSYKKLINDKCLKLNLDYPISGRSKEIDDCTEVVTFTNNWNPVRRLDINKIPYKFTFADDACTTKVFTDKVDCDALNLFRQIDVPLIEITKTASGSLSNGMYQFCVAYDVNSKKYSDYYALSIPIPIFDQSKSGGGLSVKISNLDRTFDQFELVMIETVDGVTTAKKIGIFSTSQEIVNISTNNREEYTTVNLSDLVITKINYEKAGIISGNSQYLMLADLTQKARLNYQKLAFQINAEYVVSQKLSSYYKDDGKDVGHYRDEVYRYWIRFLYPDGSFSEAFHIPGRKILGDEKSSVSGPDIYEFDNKTGIERPKQVYKFQAVNTAQKMIQSSDRFVNNEREFGRGFLAYHESEELNGDNIEMYGEEACLPIRDHRMPDEAKVPRYSVIDGENYVNVLGIRFKDIPHPLDENGDKVNVEGYEILRAERSGGNKTVIARGLMTNVRSYTEQSPTNADESVEVLFANYPYNSLAEDGFFSASPTLNRGSNEGNYSPIKKHYSDRFNFYTPHGYFGNKYKMGREFILETEEIATVKGKFEPVYQHPRHKLLTNFSLYFSILVGVVEGLIEQTGKQTNIQNSNTTDAAGTAIGTYLGGTTTATGSIYPTHVIQRTDTAFHILGINKNMNPLEITGRAIIIALQVLAAAGVFIFASAEHAADAIKIILGFSQYSQYAYQYNSHGFFNSQVPIVQGNKRRFAMKQPFYLSSGVQTIDDKKFNNFGKQSSIYVQLNKEIKDTKTEDDSRKTMTRFGVANAPDQEVTSTASAFYATSKIKNPAQYGQIDTGRKVKTTNSVIPITEVADTYTSPTIFGGDCIIQRFSILTKQPIFQQSLEGYNVPDGTEFNYKLYRNIAYPRFWADFSPYQVGDLITKSPSMGKLPASKYNLDGRGNSGKSLAWTVQDRYFYTSINGVLDFFAEADYNISFREEVENKPFYSENSAILSEIFRSDRVKVPEVFKLDPSFSKLEADQIYAPQQTLDYNPTVDNQCKKRDRNALIYSLPSFKGTKIDNWQYFLPNNFFSFDQNDFGNLTTIKKLDQDRVIFLFDKSSPYVSFGQNELQIGDSSITIGDGGLFARPPRELEHTDVYYGNSKSRYAFVSTQFGAFYPSFSQGRIFNFTGRLEEISDQGIHYWCQQYMPIKLYEYYLNYPQIENPMNRVGYFTFFDNSSKTIYITKRDFIPKPNFNGKLLYDASLDKFVLGTRPIELGDDNYFDDVSWTLSYSPETRSFLSFHDWHPDGVIQTENHFMTIKGNSIWKHGERNDSYCNFYGNDYPYELEYCSNTGKQVHTVNSIEYILESYIYKNGGMDKFHDLYDNFTKLIVYNSEQASGLLTLNHESDNPYANELFPKANGVGYDILFAKREQKYRVNQFDDLVKDRGEYSGAEYPIFFSHGSGYKRILNPTAINLEKPSIQRKRFRHYTNFFWFSKDLVGPNKIINKFFDTQLTISYE